MACSPSRSCVLLFAAMAPALVGGARQHNGNTDSVLCQMKATEWNFSYPYRARSCIGCNTHVGWGEHLLKEVFIGKQCDVEGMSAPECAPYKKEFIGSICSCVPQTGRSLFAYPVGGPNPKDQVCNAESCFWKLVYLYHKSKNFTASFTHNSFEDPMQLCRACASASTSEAETLGCGKASFGLKEMSAPSETDAPDQEKPANPGAGEVFINKLEPYNEEEGVSDKFIPMDMDSDYEDEEAEDLQQKFVEPQLEDSDTNKDKDDESKVDQPVAEEQNTPAPAPTEAQKVVVKPHEHAAIEKREAVVSGEQKALGVFKIVELRLVGGALQFEPGAPNLTPDSQVFMNTAFRSQLAKEIGSDPDAKYVLCPHVSTTAEASPHSTELINGRAETVHKGLNAFVLSRGLLRQVGVGTGIGHYQMGRSASVIYKAYRGQVQPTCEQDDLAAFKDLDALKMT